jgi:hypothetical protein
MTLLGLGPEAQAVILQALATYAGIISAFFFARPVLRWQPLQSQRDLLAGLKPTDPEIMNLVRDAASALDSRLQKGQPRASRDNYLGVLFLVVSCLLFTSAVVLQVEQAANSPAPNQSISH